MLRRTAAETRRFCLRVLSQTSWVIGQRLLCPFLILTISMGIGQPKGFSMADIEEHREDDHALRNRVPLNGSSRASCAVLLKLGLVDRPARKPQAPRFTSGPIRRDCRQTLSREFRHPDFADVSIVSGRTESCRTEPMTILTMPSAAPRLAFVGQKP